MITSWLFKNKNTRIRLNYFVFCIFAFSLFLYSQLSSINAKNVYAGVTCREISKDNYACFASGECGTNAGCGATCDSPSGPFDIRCGGTNTCDLGCSPPPPPPSDVNPPSCTLPSISPSSPVNASSISINAAATDDIGITAAGLYVVDPLNNLTMLVPNNTANNGSFSYNWNTPAQSGNYQFQVNWYDASGKTSQCQVNFVIDKIPPVCNDTNFAFVPSVSPSGANTFDLTVTATDSGSGIDYGGIYYLGPLPSSTNTAIYANNQDSTGTMTVTGRVAPVEGKYTFQANWWDNAGNFKQCTKNYNFDRHPPTTTLTGSSQVCLGTSSSYSVTANAQNGLDIAYFTYYKPSTSSWQTNPFPLYASGLSGTSYTNSGSIAFTTGNGFAAGNSYYVASGAYDDLGMKCSGNQILFPTNPNTIVSGAGWNYCGDSSRLTVSVITMPSAVTNLRDTSTSSGSANIRWTGVSTNINDYTISTPSGTQQTTSFCSNGTSNCGANFITGPCTNNYTYTVSEKNACGTSSSTSVTSSPNCIPTCSLSIAAGDSNPAAPGTTIAIDSTVNAGDPGDYISNWNWIDNGPDKGSYYSGSATRAQYTLMNRYGATTTLKQNVYDSINSAYEGTCSLTVKTNDPTITVGPTYPISITKSSTAATTQKQGTVYSTLLNDNSGTLTYNQSATLTYNSVSYKNICKEAGVTCSFSGTSNVTSTSILGAGVPKGLYITVPRALTPGAYAYGMTLSSTKWDGTPISNQSNNLVTIINLAPTCIKPTLSEYATYGSVGYPLSKTITATGSATDLDGTIVSYNWPAPSVGSIALANRSLNPTSYVTSSSYNTSTAISYTVTDSSGGTSTCTSEAIKTIIQSGVTSSWANYAIDTNQNIADTKSITVTQNPTTTGFSVNMNLAIDTTSATVNNGTSNLDNICRASGVTCVFTANNGLTINENVTSTATSTAKAYAIKVTVPVNIPVKNYGIGISGATTYLGSSYNVSKVQTVFITAAPSTITVQCADGSTTSPCPTTYSSNRGWVSGAIAFNIVSSKFNGNFSVTEDVTSACGDTGVTCTFSTTAAGTYTASLSNQALATDATKIIYMKIATTNLSLPKAYLAKFTVVGIRNIVNTSTGNQSSPTTSFTLVNQNPICGTQTYTYNPASPIAKGGTTTLTVGGGTDPDSDPVTYGAWYATGAKSITAASTNSATVVMNNVFDSCANISYKVYDNQTPQGVSVATCAVASSLCTIKDNVRPTATLTLAYGSMCKGVNYNTSYSFSDADTNLTSVSINKKSPVSTIATKSGNLGGSTSLSSVTAFDTVGTYYIYPTATDALGNTCDSSGANTCGAGTYKTITVTENTGAPAMTYVPDPTSESKGRISFTKDANLDKFDYLLTYLGALSFPITCGGTSGNDCYADVDTGANSCTKNYVLELQEVDSNNCVAISSVTISPNCFPTCTKPVLGDYATYSAAGYPLSHTMSVTGSGSDNDGTIKTYTWGKASSPGVGTLTQVNAASTSYVTSSNYDASTNITYSVEDSSGAVIVCPVSDTFKTQLQPGASTGWFNYSIDINKTLSNTQNFTVTESATDTGFTMNSKFDIVASGQYTSGTTLNICNISGVKCELSAGVVGFDETYATTAGSTAKTYAFTVTVPNNIAAGTYGIKISGSTTYRGLVLTGITNEKAVIISASTSDILITCPSNSACASSTSQNRGWVSGAILYKVASIGFAGTFKILTDPSSMCGVSGATCTFSTDGITFSSTLASVSLTANQTKDIYMKVSTTKSIPPNTYGARFIANGTRAVVGSSTGNKTSQNTAITMLNQAPVCAPIGANNYNPTSPVPLGQTVTITASGGTDPDGDSLTYSSWSTSGVAISPVSGSTNSARVTMPNTYNTCYEIRYRVTDQYGAVSALPVCSVPTTLCTIVDSVPPQASITTGADSVCKGISYPVAFSYTDNDVLAEVSIMKKDPVATVATKTVTAVASTTLSGSTTFDTAGTSYVYATAKDKNNNVCDSSVTATTCGAGTIKTVTVNENASSPAMSFVTDASDPKKVRVTWTKQSTLPQANYVFTRASGTAGTLSSISCSGDSCGVDITGLDCTASYSYNLQETDANTCKASSTIANVSPNCAPTCKTPTITNPLSVYPLNTSQTINSTRSGTYTYFDPEDLNAVTHIWAPSLSGTGLGGITAGGATATYLTPNRNNITVQVAHSVRDTGGPNDNNFVTVLCGAVSFPMAADTLSTPVFSPGAITIARTTANPTGTSNFTYSLANFQAGTFAIDTTNTNNASFIGNNICALTSLVTCSASTTAPVGNNQSVPVTITFKNDARVNFNTVIAGGYKVLGKITYATTNASNVVVNKTAQAYYSVTIADTAPTCLVYSRLKSTDAWADVTGKYFTYAKGAKVQVRTVGADVDGDTIGSYAWSASAGTITPTNTQESEYTVYAVNGLNATVTGRVNESAPNTKFGTCSTVMKTPDPGTHSIAAGSIDGNDTSATVAYSYSGYVNANNGVGVNGTSTISSGAIAGYTNLCAVTGVTCKFEGQNVGTGLTIASGASGSKNIIVTLGSTRLDNTKLYAIKVLFSASTADGGTITASTTGGIISIIDAVPACGTIVVSPLTVLSGSTSLVGVTVTGTDDWKMGSIKLEYNADPAGTTTGTWTAIGSPITTFTNPLSPSAVFNWQPGTLVVGSYQLRATLTDNHSPVAQSIVCDAINSTTPPSFGGNTPLVGVTGNRFSGRVLIQSDGPDVNTPLYKVARKDAITPTPVEFGISNSTWIGSSANCTSTYPDGTNDTSTNTCTDFFVSTTAYLSGATVTASITNPNLTVAGVTTPKYLCTYDVIRRTVAGVRSIVASGSGCSATFSMEVGDSTYTSSSRWTTEVDYYLTYNTDRVSGQVLNYAGAALSGYTVTNPYASGVSSAATGWYYYTAGNDSKDYFPDGARTFTLSGATIGSAASINKCFYAFNSNGATNSFTAANVKSIAQGTFSLSGWTIAEGCTTSALTLVHKNLSPQRQNYLYFFVVPKITVDPASTITYVADCSSVTSIGALPITPTVDLYDPSVLSGNKIGKSVYDSANGKFSMVDMAGTASAELKWSKAYQVNLLSNVNYTVCNSLSPSFTVGTVSTEPNVNSTLSNYPSVTSTDNQVKFTFRIAPKNNNDWWQVYNGGAHANGFMNLYRLPNVFVNLNTVKAPVVGRLTNALATQVPPEVLYISGLSSYYYVPALVSSFYTSNINFNNGTAGLTSATGSSNKNWSAHQMNNSMAVAYDDKFFTEVQTSWTNKTTFPSALGNASPVYLGTTGSPVNLSHSTGDKNTQSRPIVIIGNLNITRDLESTSTGPLIIIVKGNVVINWDVAIIQATIYATGTITVNTHGDQTDPILNVTGSLIADKLIFNRDLANILTNVGVPSQKINFDARVISGTRAYPISMKQANAYWVVTD